MEKIKKDQKNLALASLVIGIVGILYLVILILYPMITHNPSLNVYTIILGIFICLIELIGLILGIIGIKSSKRKLAIIGIILCAIGFVMTILIAISVFFLVVRGIPQL